MSRLCFQLAHNQWVVFEQVVQVGTRSRQSGCPHGIFDLIRVCASHCSVGPGRREHVAFISRRRIVWNSLVPGGPFASHVPLSRARGRCVSTLIGARVLDITKIDRSMCVTVDKIYGFLSAVNQSPYHSSLICISSARVDNILYLYSHENFQALYLVH